MHGADFFSSVGDLFDNRAVQVGATIAAAVVLQFIIHATIARIVRRTVRRHRHHSLVDEEKRENTLITIFRTASSVVLWTIALIVALWQLKINLAALMTGAGLIGIVVGFGAQNLIKDFLAGIFILSENQYRVGDIVTLKVGGAEVSGAVEEVTIRITRLRDLDGNLHIVQNSAANIVSNLSFGYANVNIDLRVGYDTDIDKIEQLINKLGEELSKDDVWSPHIIEPIHFLRVDGFEDFGVRVKALGRVEPAKQWDIAGEFRRRIKVAFDKQGITIPLPQVVVHQAKGRA